MVADGMSFVSNVHFFTLSDRDSPVTNVHSGLTPDRTGARVKLQGANLSALLGKVLKGGHGVAFVYWKQPKTGYGPVSAKSIFLAPKRPQPFNQAELLCVPCRCLGNHF